jgi:hypothetical protein
MAMSMTSLDPGVERLLRAEEPVIRCRALTELAGAPADDPRAVEARRQIAAGPIVRRLLDGLGVENADAPHPYSKWRGAHWRLVSLMDLGVPSDLPGMRAAMEPILGWLLGQAHRSNIPTIDGLPRRCASQEGNALAVAVHLGLASDERTAVLANSLTGWQWPDGGWNCDRKPDARHSSFHETLPAFRGLAAYVRATRDPAATAAADRAAEFFLRHRVMFRERTGERLSPAATHIHYPPYWHYDFFAGLRVLAESGHVTDSRTAEAIDHLVDKRRDDGAWASDAVHFRAPGSAGSNVEVVDWGRRQPSEPVTLGALLILRTAGRL